MPVTVTEDFNRNTQIFGGGINMLANISNQNRNILIIVQARFPRPHITAGMPVDAEKLARLQASVRAKPSDTVRSTACAHLCLHVLPAKDAVCLCVFGSKGFFFAFPVANVRRNSRWPRRAAGARPASQDWGLLLRRPGEEAPVRPGSVCLLA